LQQEWQCEADADNVVRDGCECLIPLKHHDAAKAENPQRSVAQCVQFIRKLGRLTGPTGEERRRCTMNAAAIVITALFLVLYHHQSDKNGDHGSKNHGHSRLDSISLRHFYYFVIFYG